MFKIYFGGFSGLVYFPNSILCTSLGSHDQNSHHFRSSHHRVAISGFLPRVALQGLMGVISVGKEAQFALKT
jgi:hypothetical protein